VKLKLNKVQQAARRKGGGVHGGSFAGLKTFFQEILKPAWKTKRCVVTFALAFENRVSKSYLVCPI
jgi:hypothetical protein